ncbi:ficolin-2-like [Mya arenaria]|uniref:ficolin-2-like n=1 Tax=Mya arenaria TaxID=6604 RepID=UPI0022DEF99F|nr:ficolin-2-like [Mya arenaria]
MASLKTEAVVLNFALILHVVSVSGECVDLDVFGCRNNPHLCHDDLLAEVTCPMACNRCPTQPTTAPQPTQAEPHSCLDIMRLGIGSSSGVYSVYAPISRRRVQLFCDLETDGGGWIVFQNRFNGSVDFFRPFADYEEGFGTKYGEF